MVRTLVLFAVLVGGSLAALTSAGAETALERGTYLMKSIVDCGQCHTLPAAGAPELAGGRRFVTIAFSAYATNLTPDSETGIGKWTDAELVDGIRNGERPHGSTIGPPMPIRLYRGMSDEDAKAIVAYLRSVKPVHNAVRKSIYRIPALDYGPPVTSVAAVSETDPVAYGRYLVSALGQCMGCHSRPGENGIPDLVNGYGAGGDIFKTPWGTIESGNLTPNGIGHFTDDQLFKIITTGVRPDGLPHLLPPMPVASYAHMKEKDVRDIIAYLRTIPKK